MANTASSSRQSWNPATPKTRNSRPTRKPTRSNYTRVHGEAAPAYLEYFQDHPDATILLDQRQSE